jgi:hypothetical protein
VADNLAGLGGLPVFRVEPQWEDSFETDYQISRDIFRFPGTSEQIISINPERPTIAKLKFLFTSKEKEFEFWTFFNDRCGMLEKFWLLSPSEFFYLSEPITNGVNNITVKLNGFLSFRKGYERIYLLLTNGDLVTFKIDDAVSGPGADEQTLVTNTSDRS